jgi:hypothetical protein
MPNITDIYIQFIDINTTARLLSDQKKLVDKSPYKFLTSKERYEEFQAINKRKLTDKFLIQRYPVNHLHESEVWRRYMQTCSGAQPDYWDKQVPFYVRLKKHEMKWAGPIYLADRIIKIDSYLLLNTLGWSMRVELRIKNNFTPAKLKEIIVALRNTSNKYFNLNGETYSLNGLSQQYRNTLIADQYIPAIDAPRPNYSHLTFIVTPGVYGTLRPVNAMLLIDLESIVDILFQQHGNLIFVTDEYGMTIPHIPGLTTTVFGNNRINVSFTDYKTGTFSFLQDAIGHPALDAQIVCYGKNVCDFTWLSEQWINYKKQLSSADPKPVMNNLLKNGLVSLKGLKNCIRNPTILGMYNTNKELAGL